MARLTSDSKMTLHWHEVVVSIAKMFGLVSMMILKSVLRDSLEDKLQTGRCLHKGAN